jgi:hypothetical protein
LDPYIALKDTGDIYNPNGWIEFPSVSEKLPYLWGDEVTGTFVISSSSNPPKFDILRESGGDSRMGWMYDYDPYGHEVSFTGKAEEHLADGVSFTYHNNALNQDFDMVFPSVRTAQEQLTCAPYLELIQDGDGNVTGFTIRFVNAANPSATLKKSADNDVWRVDKYEIAWVGEDDRYEDDDEFTKVFGYGDDLTYTYNLPFEAVRPLSDIHFFQIRFKYESGIDSTAHYPEELPAHVFYEWNFYVNPVGGEIPAMVRLLESDDEKNAAKSQVSTDLGIDELNVTIASEGDDIFTDADATASISDGQRDRASAALSVNVPVNGGGALVVASGISFPLNVASLGGESLPVAKDFTEVKKLYGVYKIFDDGSTVDLLEKYGDAAFSYSLYDGVTLDATLVIVDDEAPSDSDVVVGGVYGVKLADDYLYIYDGQQDGNAKDPIAFAAKQSQGNSGGGNGGCNAGVAGFTVLLGALVAMAKKRVR